MNKFSYYSRPQKLVSLKSHEIHQFFYREKIHACILPPDHPCAGKAGWESLHKVFLSVAEKCSWVDVLHNKQIGPRLLVN